MHVDVVTGRRLHRRSRAPSWLREGGRRKRKEEGEERRWGRQAGLALVDAPASERLWRRKSKGTREK